MAAPGEPRSPRVRSALEWMRVGVGVVLSGLLAHNVLVRGPFETSVLLLGGVSAVLGLVAIDKVLRRDG